MHAQTRRQREVFEFITRYIESHGYRPSYQVIARHLGVSSRAGIGRIVRDLEAQGLLTRRRENGHFYIDVGAQSGAEAVAIAWLDVPGGLPASEPWESQSISIPSFMLGYQTPDRIRAFRVTDDALVDDGICKDDVALVETRHFARDGERVVAHVPGDSAIMRKYYRAGAHINLRPSCSRDEFQPIDLPADKVSILAVYRGLLRPIF